MSTPYATSQFAPPPATPSAALPSTSDELQRLEAEADATLREIDAAAHAAGKKAALVRRVAEDLAGGDWPIAPEERTVIEQARQAAVPQFDPRHFIEERTALRMRAMRAEINLLRSMLQAARAHRQGLDGLDKQLQSDENRLTDIATRARAARQAPPPAVEPPPLQSLPHMQQAAVDCAERRQFERKQLQVAVDFQSDHNFFTGLTNDISEGGLFVATINLLPIGTPVSLSFSLPSGYILEVQGQVRWVREWNDRTPEVYPGMGVQFSRLGDDMRAAIEGFIDQREPDFFTD